MAVISFSHVLSLLDSFQREKRKVREQCENIRRNSSSSRRVSQLQNGEVVEAVTLFEVVSMGKRAMQVFPALSSERREGGKTVVVSISCTLEC